MHEWALLFFTLIMQAAIGGMCMLWLFRKQLVKNVGQDVLFVSMKKPLYMVAGLSVVGLAASFFHLGTPTHAFYTISNLGTSWMSREILFTGLFIAGALITLYVALRKKSLPTGLALATGLIGLIDIFIMSSLYAETFINGWNSVNTYVSFYGTMLILGSVFVGSFLATALRKEKQTEAAQQVVHYSFYIALLGLLLELVFGVVYGFTIPAPVSIQGASAINLLEQQQTAVLIRYILSVVGVGFMGVLAMSKSGKAPFQMAYLSLAVVIVAEFIGRYSFFTLGA